MQIVEPPTASFETFLAAEDYREIDEDPLTYEIDETVYHVEQQTLNAVKRFEAVEEQVVGAESGSEDW